MKKLLFTIAALTFLVSAASADILWDQSDLVADWSGYWDSESGCGFSGATIHAATDFWTGDEVTVESVTVYYDPAFPFETEAVTYAYLMIAPKTGPLPVTGVDIPNETLVPVTVTMGSSGAYEITASGLSEYLTQGEYWITLSPLMAAGGYGVPSFHTASTVYWGDPTAIIEYCGFFAPAWSEHTPGQDASILIEGTVNVVPNAETTWGDMKNMFR